MLGGRRPGWRGLRKKWLGINELISEGINKWM